jgi:hypothetical protein
VTGLAAVLRQLRRAGYRVTRARSGHWHVRDSNGRLVAVTSATPSDRRAIANLRATVRRGTP